LWSGGGYCFEHELNFDPGQRTDGGGHKPGGRIRRVQFQPVEATQLDTETQSAKERDAAKWWAALEVERKKLANHPRFPNTSVGASDDNDNEASHPSGVWTDGMKQANAAIRDRTNQLRSEHAHALSELKALQARVGRQLTEEETQDRALAREQRKVEAATLRELMERNEKKRKTEEAQRAEAAERARADNDALSILQRTQHSDALVRRSKELMRKQLHAVPRSSPLRNAIADSSLNDPDSAAYQAVAHDLEKNAADQGSRPGSGGTLASLRAAGSITPQRMAAEVEARLIVQDAALLASHEQALATANAQAEADEQLEIEASEAPDWSEWTALKSGGVEIALASEALFQLSDSAAIDANANADVHLAAAVADTSASSVLDDTLGNIAAEIAALEQMHAGAEADAE
jgi:hypothetical protein